MDEDTKLVPAVVGGLSLMLEIQRTVDGVTDKELRRSRGRLAPIGKEETQLGVVESPELWRLWAACDKFLRLQTEALTSARFDADDEEESDTHKLIAGRLDQLGDIARAIFWAQLKEDIGGAIWREQSLGLRAGWCGAGRAVIRSRHCSPVLVGRRSNSAAPRTPPSPLGGSIEQDDDEKE